MSGMGLKFHESIIERLEALAKTNSLVFIPESAPGFEWMQTLLVSPGVRRRFALEGSSSGIVGMIVVPEEEREIAVSSNWKRLNAMGNRR